MAERVTLSPGVFDREIDETVRVGDTEGVGPAVVSPRAKGPAMRPLVLRRKAEDATVFGDPAKTGRDFGAYTTRLILDQETVPVTQIRLLGMSDTGVVPGYTISGSYAILASGTNVVAILHVSGAAPTLQGTLTSSVDQLAVLIPGFNGGVAVTASLNRNDANYIKKILNTDPTQFHTKKHFVQAVYDYANKTPASNNAFAISAIAANSAFTDEFITGSTTVTISQPFGSTEYDLFGVGSKFAGDSANTEVKVSISNIKKSPNATVSEFGSFDVLVRSFADNDRNAVILESFTNCDLDPESPNYVCRMIGDRFEVWNKTNKKFDVFGDYPSKSNYIYIIPSTDLKNGAVPATALPWGFKGYRTLTSGAVGNKAPFPALPLVSNMLFKNNFTTKIYFGAAIIDNASGSINYGVPDRLKHFASTATAASGVVDASFSLKFLSAAIQNASGLIYNVRLTDTQISAMSTSIQYSASTNLFPISSGSGFLSLENIENTALAKFTMPIADGFDGVDVVKEDPFSPEDMASESQYQTYAYRTAVDMLSNPDTVSLTELVLPGVHAAKVTDYALEKAEDRNDLLYIMDISGASVTTVVNNVLNKQLDSSYAAAYYPWVKIFDEINNKFTFVPPTTVIPAVYAYNDKVAYAWFAPAGMTRGGLKQFGVVEAKDALTRTERDKLYDNRINPIATFPGVGLVVWGNKTLQQKPSALDRINVRRLLINVRREVGRISRELVFEPNVANTWGRFKNKVDPFINRVKVNSGVDDFQVVLDTRTTTEDLIERNIMYAKIAIKPTRSAEYVFVDFHITNNTATFLQ